MNEKERRNLGAHYTSEKNILKVIKPLFLDELWDEFNNTYGNKTKLNKLHEKISKLLFLDPACGCGNFLIIAYRELRILELEIVKKLLTTDDTTKLLLLPINEYFLVDVDQFYGIEYEEFPSQIAQVAMWLMDHQMNMIAGEAFGEYMPRIPLKKSPVILHANALRIDWQSLINPLSLEIGRSKFHFILGNPPFIGKQVQNKSQREDMETIFAGVKGAGVLDYVTAWYIKAANYMIEYNALENSHLCTKSAFVSTNSICQGEQAGILWNELLNSLRVKIHFAHQTFKWSNEAKGVAAVHCVIVGFSCIDSDKKVIYLYENINSEPKAIRANNINSYLVDAKDVFLFKRTQPVCNIPEMSYGSMANDGGHLLLTDDDRADLLKKEPRSVNYIRSFIGSQEFINKVSRWCLWLVDIYPNELNQFPSILEKVNQVRNYRLKSKRDATRKLASTPTLFGEIRQPSTDYLIVPGVSSINRVYIPIGFIDKKTIASDLARTIPEASLYLFGILNSSMHMIWVRYVCGRLKSDYRYSGSLVYNNFPWPVAPTEKLKLSVEQLAQAILNVREQFPDANYADLYDRNTMPPALVKAHQLLDKAVDQCYRPQPFTTEAKRIELLFELYDKYTAGMFPSEKKSRKSKTK
jgi:hypothetical protein